MHEEEESLTVANLRDAVEENGVHVVGAVICRGCNTDSIVLVPQSRGFESVECVVCGSHETDIRGDLL